MVQKKINSKILLVALLVILSITIAVIPSVISGDVEVWCKQIFGPTYILYLFGIMLVGSIVVMFLISSYTKEVFSDSKKIQLKKFGIPPTKANQSLLKDAKAAISQSANTEQALLLLGSIRSNSLDVEIALLNARLVEESRIRRQGIASHDEVSRAFNRITKDTLYLIRELEKEINSEEVQDETIRTYLQNRYFFRLSQKLSGRQPVNLKYISSTEGTSEETSVYYVFKGNKEIQQGISQIFREANGRLLIIGDPGAGKTTLLLQLALDLLKNEPNGIPVMLNLATWIKEFISIETWLTEILPAELGITKRAGQELVEQNRLVLILDGFDEIKEEDRNECLEAIGQYSVIGERRFVISSRKKEFIHVTKDAPVYAQIEIRPLTVEQIIEALDKVGYDQPEAKPLILALQKDKLLGEVAQTPFYFNLLQLLFAGGKRLSDFNFYSTDVENRRKEILECFVLHALSPKQPGDYTEKQLQRWLAFLHRGLS